MTLHQELKKLSLDLITAIKAQQVGEVKRLVRLVEDSNIDHKIIYSYKESTSKNTIYLQLLDCPNYYIFWLIVRTNINKRLSLNPLSSHLSHARADKNNKIYNIDPFGKNLIHYYSSDFKAAQELAEVFMRYNILTGRNLPREIWGIIFVLKAKTLYNLTEKQLGLIYENALQNIKARLTPKRFQKVETQYDLNLHDMDQVAEYMCNKLQHSTTSRYYYRCKDAVIDSILANRYDVFRFAISNVYTTPDKLLDKDGSSLLHIAAKSGAIDVMEYLLAQDYEIENRNLSDVTPLMVAIENNQFDFVASILEHGASVSYKGQAVDGPLILAFNRDRKVFANLDINKDNFKKTMLHLLIKKGANIYEIMESRGSFSNLVKQSWPEIYPLMVADFKLYAANKPAPKITSPLRCFQGMKEPSAQR